MKVSNKSLFVLFFALFAPHHQSTHTHAISEPSRIIELTELELKNALKNKQATVIVGTMNHCSHCNKLHAIFETLPEKYPMVNFFSVNGPEHKLHEKVKRESKEKFRIPGYPSIVFIKNGEIKNLQIGGNEKSLYENIKKLINQK